MIAERMIETEEMNEFKGIRCTYFDKLLNLRRNGKTVFFFWKMVNTT